VVAAGAMAVGAVAALDVATGGLVVAVGDGLRFGGVEGPAGVPGAGTWLGGGPAGPGCGAGP